MCGHNFKNIKPVEWLTDVDPHLAKLNRRVQKKLETEIPMDQNKPSFEEDERLKTAAKYKRLFKDTMVNGSLLKKHAHHDLRCCFHMWAYVKHGMPHHIACIDRSQRVIQVSNFAIATA